MSNRAQYLGAVGTIVNGRVRDLQEHRDLDYPVFARDVGTTAPQEVLRVGKVRTCCCHCIYIDLRAEFLRSLRDSQSFIIIKFVVNSKTSRSTAPSVSNPQPKPPPSTPETT
jgi:hypothetical protein